MQGIRLQDVFLAWNESITIKSDILNDLKNKLHIVPFWRRAVLSFLNKTY